MIDIAKLLQLTAAAEESCKGVVSALEKEATLAERVDKLTAEFRRAAEAGAVDFDEDARFCGEITGHEWVSWLEWLADKFEV